MKPIEDLARNVVTCFRAWQDDDELFERPFDKLLDAVDELEQALGNEPNAPPVPMLPGLVDIDIDTE